MSSISFTLCGSALQPVRHDVMHSKLQISCHVSDEIRSNADLTCGTREAHAGAGVKGNHMPPALRATETFSRLHERFAPARLHVAASALEAEHLSALAARATWCSDCSALDSSEWSTGHSTAATGEMPMLVGKWPLLLHAHLLLVRRLVQPCQPCAVSYVISLMLDRALRQITMTVCASIFARTAMP